MPATQSTKVQRKPAKRSIPRERVSGVRLREAPSDASVPSSADVARVIARACHAAASGLDVTARRGGDAGVSAQLVRAAQRTRTAAEAAAALVPEGVRAPSMSERLRWEWLASTAALVDGAPERRLVEEAYRRVRDAAEAAARIDGAAMDRVADLVAMALSAVLGCRDELSGPPPSTRLPGAAALSRVPGTS
jgi:hypothetical protein